MGAGKEGCIPSVSARGMRSSHAVFALNRLPAAKRKSPSPKCRRLPRASGTRRRRDRLRGGRRRPTICRCDHRDNPGELTRQTHWCEAAVDTPRLVIKLTGRSR